GIAYRGSAAGTARNNICNNNNSAGIRVEEGAEPKLEANTCQQNGENGIAFSGIAGGTASNNICTGNKGKGIAVGEQAKPVLRANGGGMTEHSVLCFSARRRVPRIAANNHKYLANLHVGQSV